MTQNQGYIRESMDSDFMADVVNKFFMVITKYLVVCDMGLADVYVSAQALVLIVVIGIPIPISIIHHI